MPIIFIEEGPVAPVAASGGANLPHLAAPFAIGRHGAATVEQDAPGDLEARAYNVLVCTQGFREENPEFGIPSPLFKTVPLNLAVIRGNVSRWAEVEPEIAEHADAVDAAVRTIMVEV